MQELTTELYEQDIDMLIINDRNDSVHQLEEDLVVISEIMNDLSSMIHMQGQDIDQCASHVEVATENTEIATENLQQASQHQSSFRLNLWIGAAMFSGLTLGGIGLAFVVPIVGAVTAAVSITGAATCAVIAIKK